MRFIFLIFGLISYSCWASQQNLGSWLGTFSHKQLNEHISVWMETQVRYNLELGQTGQVLYRSGLLQKKTQKEQLGYLYGFIQTQLTREHRMTLQHTYKYSKYNLSHRARIEGRFFERDFPERQDGARFRYLLRADNRFDFVVWNEVFLHLGRTDWNNGMLWDRNRLFLGHKKNWGDSNRMEWGYLNQFIPQSTRDVSEHLIVFYFFF